MGLTLGWWTMQNRSELDYGTVGLDFVGSEGQGGALIAPRKTWEKSLIRWVWSLYDSFGFPFGCLCRFELLGVILRGVIVFPFAWQVCS